MCNRLTDDEIIDLLSDKTGVMFSDEQIAILKHRGGMCISASAGSGKTSTLTNLICKRILSGEISNPDNLLCTTYSKAGADEMSIRLKALMETVGIRSRVTVKTMHALYLNVIKYFGYNASIISAQNRARLIRECCNELKLPYLQEEDFLVLDSCLSFQVNNLLSDDRLCKSYVYTISEIISPDIYKEIRMKYASKKAAQGWIDFDDMQLIIYNKLCIEKNQTVIDYCRYNWKDVYVDEAQDMSKIQYAILKQIIVDGNHLVVIGDDDQCLTEGTKVMAFNEIKNIEDIKVGEKVACGNGDSGITYAKVYNTSKKSIDTDIVVVETSTGRQIKATKEHIAFARLVPSEDNSYDKSRLTYTMFSSEDKDRNNRHKSILEFESTDKKCIDIVNNYMDEHTSTTSNLDHQEEIIRNIVDDCKSAGVYLEVNKEAKFGDNKYMEMNFGNLIEGMYIPVVNEETGKINEELINKVTREKYTGYVYDLTLPDSRNFVANGVIVHNCIYEWRGADPSIMLNACAHYDLSSFTLTTNYRCKSNIVDMAHNGIVNNVVRTPKQMKAYKQGGEVGLVDTKSNDLYEISKKAYKYIKGLVDGGEDPKNIAILSRNNNSVGLLVNLLFKNGIYSETKADMCISNNPLFKNIRDIIGFSMDNDDKYTKNVLPRLCNYMKMNVGNEFVSLQISTCSKISDVLGYVIKHICTISTRDVEWKDNIILPAVLQDKLANGPLGYMKYETQESLVDLYKVMTEPDEKLRAENLLKLFQLNASFMWNSDPDKTRNAEGFIRYYIDLIEELGVDGTLQFMNNTEQFEKGQADVLNNKICVSTMHGAKGREWQHVVIIADDNYVFPSFKGINLQEYRGVGKTDIYNNIEEQRRLHYVACTRAKTDLTIFMDFSNMGVFLLECLGVIEKTSNNTELIYNLAINQNTLSGTYKDKINDLFYVSGELKHLIRDI